MSPEGKTSLWHHVRTLTGGGFAGLLAVLYAISFAHLVFTGPLAAHVDRGVGMALTGTFLLAFLGAISRGSARMLWQIQGPVVVLLAASSQSIAVQMDGRPTAEILATMTLVIVLTAALIGAVMYLVGQVRIARIAKSIPYPVVGGFLAATGYFLLLAAINFALQDRELGWHMLTADRVGLWTAPLLAAAAMVLARRWFSTAIVLPAGTLLYVVVAYLSLWISGTTVEAATQSGFLLGNPGGMSLQPITLPPSQLAGADVGVIWGQAPLILTAVAMAVLGALLNLQAIEFAGDRPVDLNREIRQGGLANLAVSLAGGFPGYQATTLTQLGETIQPGAARGVALAMSGVIAAIIILGMPFLGLLPRGAFVMLLAYLGIDFLQRWLVFERRRMPRDDYIIVWLILGIAVLEGFLVAVGVGIVVSSLRFTVAYARVETIRSRTTGRNRLSSTERSERATRHIVDSGTGTVIYEIQGYMFFGTADRVYRAIARDLEEHETPVRRLVLDFARVSGMDVSAVLMFSRLIRQARASGVSIHFASLGDELEALFYRTGAGDGVRFYGSLDRALSRLEDESLRKTVEAAGIEVHDDLDQALIAIEDASLSRAGVDGSVRSAGIRALLRRVEASGAGLLIGREQVEDGEIVFARGDSADSFVVVDVGRLEAVVEGQHGQLTRVASFLPGAVVGEMALFTGGTRTATVQAHGAGSLWRIPASELDRLRASHPELALELTELLGRMMAHRLARTTSLVYAYG